MSAGKPEQMFNRLKLRGTVLFFLVFSFSQTVMADSDVAEARRFLGLQFGSISSPLGSDDPFAFPLGVGLFFEAHPLLGDARLCWGGSALYYMFLSQAADFEDSFMVQAGLSAGFDIPCLIDGELAAALTPYFGYKEYYREYVFQGKRVSGYRGVAVMGARLSLLVAGAMLIGFDIEYNLILEEEPLDTLACHQRLGVGF